MARKAIPRVHFSTKLRPETKAEIERQAAARGVTQTEYIEQLVARDQGDPLEYFLRHASVQSFISASLVTVLAARLMPEGEVVEYRERAAKLAREIFGESPRRRFEVPRGEEPYDPRIAALFEAFGAG